MRHMDSRPAGNWKQRLLRSLAFCGGCILLNMTGFYLAAKLSLPLYLDAVGTVLSAAAGGYFPGMLTGCLTNLACGIFMDASTSYYSAFNVLIALTAAFLAKRGWFRRPSRFPSAAFFLALPGGVMGTLLTWCLAGLSFEDSASPLAQAISASGLMGRFPSMLAAGVLTDFADKFAAVLLAAAVLRLMPEHIPGLFSLDGLFQAPVTAEERELERRQKNRSLSLRTKIVLLIGLAGMLIALVSVSISAVLYKQATISEHTKLGQGVASLAAASIDPERVEDCLTLGRDAPGYGETEAMLYSIRDSVPDIQYVYVYQIQPDGCHVVFDLDTEEIAGSDPGEVVPFDESFAPYLPALLSGEPIDPIITNDTYGWLLTAYHPVYDSEGVCRCYAAADISMGQITAMQFSFVSRQVSVFMGFFLLILWAGFLCAEYNVVQPVNTIARAAGAFAYNSEDARARSLRSIRELDIRTGDEVENLYHAFVKTTEDTMRYIAEVQKKTRTITRMQNGLILVLAEMVESRDRNTGDHVRKTALYVKITMEQMRRDGVYLDKLTDEYIDLVVNAAPLHDVGKIHVPDAVLNKPGKLTDTEFIEMKDHTTAGKEIITRAIRLVPDSGYLHEARNLAAYHHERWDGTGYPTGLAGEEIPLSARIMAVADVFDALVSRRSYKEGFPIETALNIIREGSGTHFDPKVADAFLHAEAEVREAVEQFRVQYEGDTEEREKERGRG